MDRNRVRKSDLRNGESLAFEDFRIDVAALELTRRGVPTGLAPAPVRALLYLARRSGELVTREELYAHLWPDGEVDVEPALNAYIRQIRRALGAGGGEDRFIRTYPGRGYRFLPPTGARGRPSRDEAAGWLASPMKAASGIAALLVTGGAAVFGAQDSASRVAGEAGLVDLAPPVRMAYLTGTRLLDAAMPARRGAAVEHFRDVTAAQPDFAAAHSGLAESLIWARDYGGAAASARAALALAPDDARAHRALGTALLVTRWEWDRAERHLRRSVQLAPRSEVSRVALAFLLVAAGRDDAAREQLGAAVELAPASPLTTGDLGTLYLWLGDAENALELCERTLDVEPDASWGAACVRRARAALGRGPPPAPADPADATSEFSRAVALAEAGRHEEALDALEASAARRELGFVTLRAMPELRPLHGLPRFEALERRLFAES